MSETKEKKVSTPRGTQRSEVILGSASVKIGASIKALTEMFGEVGKLDSQIEENVLIITDQESKIAELSITLKNNIAQNKIELAQAYSSDKEAFVTQWLKDNSKVALDESELDELREALSNAEKVKENEIQKAVHAATGAITRNFEASKKEYELTFKAQEAENKAALGTKDEKIKFLEEQVASWKKALENEQEAGIKRAQAGAIQQTIQTGK